MKKYKFMVGIIILCTIVGLFKINLNLNRQIYLSIVEGEDRVSNELKSNYNLDNMVDVLSYPQKYNIKSTNKNEIRTNIPKIRVLFNENPFDFRIDFTNYTFSINKRVMDKLKNIVLSI